MKIKSVSSSRRQGFRRAAEEENPPLSGMIVRDRRLVPIYPTSGMRYPPIIVALSRDLEFNLSIRRRGTWYPIAPSVSKRDSTSRHFSSNFRESVASARWWRTSERAYYTKCFPSVFSAWYYPDVEKELEETRRQDASLAIFISTERKGLGARVTLWTKRLIRQLMTFMNRWSSIDPGKLRSLLKRQAKNGAKELRKH